MRFTSASVALVLFLGLVAFTSPAKMGLSSTAFVKNAMIPAKYTCEGENVSPQLRITGIPPATQSLALIVHDPDAPMKGGFTHWVMWNIGTDGTLPEGFKGAEQGLNSAHQKGYFGMCPPTGTHRYFFRVYALNCSLTLGPHTDKAALEQAMEGHILASAELMGTYRKTK